MTYHDHSDPQFARSIRKGAPEAFKAWNELKNAALKNDNGVIPPKFVELIALAVSLTTQCPYCIEAHTAEAHAAGVSETEMAEMIMIVTALRAGAGLTHGFMAHRFYQDREAAAVSV